MNISYSIWPITLFPYNLPSWMCIKKSFPFVTLLIPGSKWPEHNIDVYMKPMIAKLKELWELGADIYDASMIENFQMKVAIMWTINGFPVIPMFLIELLKER